MFRNISPSVHPADETMPVVVPTVLATPTSSWTSAETASVDNHALLGDLPHLTPGGVTNDQATGLRVTFIITSMPVGGAEVLLVNLIRHFSRNQVVPSLICLKEAGPLGLELAKEIPLVADLYRHKWDVRVVGKLKTLLQEWKTQAVVTVGAGDKMFWGRIAAKWAGVPVVASALHSTGWPDGVGRLNRWLTGWTDAFIAVAEQHAEYLRSRERFPAEKVFKIVNGVDTDRFVPNPRMRMELRRELGLSKSAPLVGIVAALREEKNHSLFIDAAKRVVRSIPDAHFVIVGDGPFRESIQQSIAALGMTHRFHLLGTRQDTPRILAGLDAFALTSHNEAFPVSILEAMSCQLPVIATDVGSISEVVREGVTGYLVEPGNADKMARRWVEVLSQPELGHRLGVLGRELVEREASLLGMVQGYERLLSQLHAKKQRSHG